MMKYKTPHRAKLINTFCFFDVHVFGLRIARQQSLVRQLIDLELLLITNIVQSHQHVFQLRHLLREPVW